MSDLGRLQGEHAAVLAARDALEVERADEAAQVADLRDALATAEAALGSQDSARRLAEDIAARAEVSRLSGDLAAADGPRRKRDGVEAKQGWPRFRARNNFHSAQSCCTDVNSDY